MDDKKNLPKDNNNWTIDENGYIRTRTNTVVAQMRDGILFLYDKRIKLAIPFTLDDWRLLEEKEKRQRKANR